MRITYFMLLPLLCAACANTVSTPILNANFAEISDTRFISLDLPGPPSGDTISVTNDRSSPSPISIFRGALRMDNTVNTPADLDYGLELKSLDIPAGTTSIVYTWTGNLRFTGEGASAVRVRFRTPSPPPQFDETALFFVLSWDGESDFFRIRTSEGLDIGQLRNGEDHSFIITVNVTNQTYKITASGGGTARSGTIRLPRSGIGPIRTPKIIINLTPPFNGENVLVNYILTSFTATALQPTR